MGNGEERVAVDVGLSCWSCVDMGHFPGWGQCTARCVIWEPGSTFVEPRISRVGISGDSTESVLFQCAPVCCEQRKASRSPGGVGEGHVGGHPIRVVKVKEGAGCANKS